MTNNGGFTIDGVPASEYGVTLEYSRGQSMLPDTRDRQVEIPGSPGQYWFDSDLKPKKFSLPCYFTNFAGEAELDVLIRAFARIFVHWHGKPRPLALIFDDAPDITYYVRYAGEVPFDRAWLGCSHFVLNLVSDDPYGYKPEDATAATITESGGSLVVTSNGNVETPAKICIKNNGSSPITGGFTITIKYEAY